MKISANDWASPDPSKNMTLAESDRFADALAGAFAVQFADRYVMTTYGQIIPVAELRRNPFLSPLPVHLQARLACGNSAEINIAQFRSALREAAAGDDPVGDLVDVLSAAMPRTDIAALLLRAPALTEAVRRQLALL